jgi:hypothetical protein
MLEKRGLIECVEVKSHVAVPLRGSVFRILLPKPALTPADSTRAKSTRVSSTGAAPAPMISDQKHDQNAGADAPADIYEVRKIAARVLELHRGQTLYTHDRLRADVCTALAGQGRDADDETIDEAIKGMAL